MPKNVRKSKYQKVGFKEVLEILSESNGGMKKGPFFRVFNRKLYYNAFYRIKDYMLKYQLIKIKDSVISITDKGLKTLDLMNYLKILIEG